MKLHANEKSIGLFLIWIASVFSHSAFGATVKVWTPDPSFPPYGIIHNSLIKSDQKIALGVNQHGNLNTPVGTGTDANNTKTLNTNLSSNIDPGSSPGAVGIAYYWEGCGPKSPYLKKCNNSTTLTYPAGWYDGTSPGARWEGWGAGAVDDKTANAFGFAFFGSENPSVDLPNLVLKSFIVDATSIKSTVWVLDSSQVPMLEVTHVYGPTSGATNKYLFQALVTVTNISGGELRDVRYRRVMDWDIIENMTGVNVDLYGVVASSDSSSLPPKAFQVCDNGGSTNGSNNNYRGSGSSAQNPNPFLNCTPIKTALNTDVTDGGGSNGANLGASFNFQLGDLGCNESALFYIYYGAAGSKQEMKDAFASVGATVYSLGYDNKYQTLVYGFGFKGVSGFAVAPTLPTKVASMPGGSSTAQYNPATNQKDPSQYKPYQTYVPPVVGDGTIYQALFQYQKDKQWVGEIKRYGLDAAGAIKTDNIIYATDDLTKRASVNGSYQEGGRSIWTVGYDPRCMSSPISNDAQNNSFNIGNASLLEKLLFNCLASPNSTVTSDLINFTRGLNAYLEETAPSSAVRKSVLGDTYHSEMVMVGVPKAPWSSESKFAKSEAYFRYEKGYNAFIAANTNRRSQIYVGANDGMLHAFDLDLNERWAFIPPSVVPMLRNMAGEKGAGDPKTSAGGGKSNSMFTVDGPITVKDVYFYAEAKWKTVLMGGLGWGGNSYYALDVTDPDAPKHLFTFNNDVSNKAINYWDASGKKSTFAYSAACTAFDYSKLGGAWSRPVIMLLPYNKGVYKQRWVAAFGGGYAGGASVTGTGSTSSFGAYAYVIELEPDGGLSTESCGALSAEAVTSTGGHVLIATPLTSDSASTIPNGVTAHLSVVTGDGTSMATYYGGIAYFTDLQGKLWKWNLSKNSLSDDNSTLFSLYQSFNAQATLANDRMGMNQLGTTIVTGQDANGNNVSRLFNYYGTGDLTRIQRRIPKNNTINNRIYGVSDANFPSPLLSTTNQTVATFTNVDSAKCSVNNSWYANVSAKTNIDPLVDFQKIVGRASVYNKYVYFTAYQPDSLSADGKCPKYGTSRIIEMSDVCQTGGAGAVIPDGLATQPVIDGKGNIYIGVGNLKSVDSLTNGVGNIVKLKATPSSNSSRIQYKSWREKRAY